MTAADLAARYRCDHGLDVYVDAHGHIILRAGAVDGIQMPQPLAEFVHTELRSRGSPTPVIVNTATRNRTFLSHGADTLDERPVRIFAALSAYQAIRTVAGALIMLPGPHDPRREWLEEPRAELRPSFDDLVRITLSAAELLPRAK
ncbi:hypothetical protein [Nocardia sp. NPDC050710]|uniref:hypothetical protein n=1 Tax=Nocardia sp. NPDC050710 TaxID=3157220 RepID=UPI003403C160